MSTTCVFLYPVVGGLSETGLKRLPFGSGVDCPDTARFKCVTTGPGTTLLLIPGDEEPIEFSHSEYKGGSSINVSRLDGDITAGNLSESNCSNMTDTCYTAYAVVRITGQTCLVITCNTTFRNGSDVTETFFGEATIVRSGESIIIIL